MKVADIGRWNGKFDAKQSTLSIVNWPQHVIAPQTYLFIYAAKKKIGTRSCRQQCSLLCCVSVTLHSGLSHFVAMWTQCVCVSFVTSHGVLLGVLRLKSLGFFNRHMIEKWGTPVEPGTSCSCLSAVCNWSSAALSSFCSPLLSQAAPRFVPLLQSKTLFFSSQRTLTPAQCVFCIYSIVFIYYLFFFVY